MLRLLIPPDLSWLQPSSVVNFSLATPFRFSRHTLPDATHHPHQSNPLYSSHAANLLIEYDIVFEGDDSKVRHVFVYDHVASLGSCARLAAHLWMSSVDRDLSWTEIDFLGSFNLQKQSIS